VGVVGGGAWQYKNNSCSGRFLGLKQEFDDEKTKMPA
jgi:hypothetical protein